MESPPEPESSIEHPSWWPADVTPGPTPAGGERSEAQYFDEQGHPCEKDRAVRMLIREVAGDGAVLKVTWGDLGAGAPAGTSDRPGRQPPADRQPPPERTVPPGAPGSSYTWDVVTPAPLPPRRRHANPGPALHFDGATFRGTLVAESPAGWFTKESITLLAPDGQANVICSSEPLDPTIDTDRYAAVQGDLLRNEFPGYQEAGFERRIIFGGHPGWWREFSWHPPDGVRINQIQLYFARDGRGYTATATTPSPDLGGLREILSRLRLDDGTGSRQ
jgi:hypothetical protein